jgi:predicted phosphodiesterase
VSEQKDKMKKTTKIATYLVIPDTHFQAPLKDGKTFHEPRFCQDPEAISLMLQFIEPYQLDGIIHLGDIAEMSTISAWNKAVQREGTAQDTNGDWYTASWASQKQMVYNFWAYLHKKYPDAKKFQLEGNHDFWSRTFFSQPAMRQFQTEAFHNWPVWKDFNIEYHAYWGGEEDPFVFINAPGHKGTVVLHGYNNGSIKKMLRDFDNVVYGHQHKVIRESIDSNIYERRRADCIGCMTKLQAEYCSKGGAQNGWAHAFAMIHVLSDGRTQVNVIDIGREMTLVTEGGTIYTPIKLATIDPLLAVLDLG